MWAHEATGTSARAAESQALSNTESGHREKAAKRLGIGVATLYRKLKERGEEGR